MLMLFHKQTNRLACLRLTERCADILLSVREEIHNAGDKVGKELQWPLQKLTEFVCPEFSVLSQELIGVLINIGRLSLCSPCSQSRCTGRF